MANTQLPHLDVVPHDAPVPKASSGMRQVVEKRWRSWRRQAFYAIALVPVFVAIHYMAYWLRDEGQLSWSDLVSISRGALVVIAIKLLVFGWFRIYQGWNRYLTFHDLLLLGKAATASSLVFALVDYLLLPATQTPRSIFLMDWGATIVFVGGLRSITRILDERQRMPWLSYGRTPAFIVGANDQGEALLRAIRRNPSLSFDVVGFITEDPKSLEACIGGVPVLGELDQTCTLAERHGVSEVFITAGKLAGQQVRRLVEESARRNVTVKVLPSYEQLLEGSVDLRPRTVSIEDLLRRDPVQLNLRELHRWIDGRVLMVTGSAGSIGSEICRQLLQFEPEKVILVDRSENGQFFLEHELRRLAPAIQLEVCVADVGDGMRMNNLFQKYRPEIVFHAAAYKHVPLMEGNPGEAVKNIVVATRRLADIAHMSGVTSFVMISTDKAVNPTSVMGTCKRVAELYVQSLASRSHCRFVTVRFGNVLDSAGSVVPIFREQIARGGPITVTHPDMTRYFMTIPEASQLVIQAGAMGQGGEIFVLDMGEPVRIVDLAKDMIRLSGLELGTDVDIEFVGMRPGEKLFEELHVDGERHLTTSHPKIMVAESDKANYKAVCVAIDNLARSADGQAESILHELQEIVPQYQATSPAPRLQRAA